MIETVAQICVAAFFGVLTVLALMIRPMQLLSNSDTYPINPRDRVEAIVEKITEMQLDLARERKAMTRLWSKRGAQIQGVIEATVGIYAEFTGP